MTRLEELLADIEAKAGAAKQVVSSRWEADYSMAFRDGEPPPRRAVYTRPTETHVVEIIETPDKLDGECIHAPEFQEHIARLDPPTALTLVRMVRELQKEVKFYADKKNWKKQTAWTGWAGFGEEPDDRQPYDFYPITNDKGKRAREALAKVNALAEELK